MELRMTQSNFDEMSREELRAYLLDHRDDEAAFHAYMDRLASEPVVAQGKPEDLQDAAHFAEALARVQRIKQERRNRGE
jgi:SOS response regulatory protein OraA/RecX